MDDPTPVSRPHETWTMPVENRLDMALTGFKTPSASRSKVRTLDGIQRLGAEVQQALAVLPNCGPSSPNGRGRVLRQREVNQTAAARYWVDVGDVQRTVTSAMRA